MCAVNQYCNDNATCVPITSQPFFGAPCNIDIGSKPSDGLCGPGLHCIVKTCYPCDNGWRDYADNKRCVNHMWTYSEWDGFFDQPIPTLLIAMTGLIVIAFFVTAVVECTVLTVRRAKKRILKYNERKEIAKPDEQKGSSKKKENKQENKKEDDDEEEFEQYDQDEEEEELEDEEEEIEEEVVVVNNKRASRYAAREQPSPRPRPVPRTLSPTTTNIPITSRRYSPSSPRLSPSTPKSFKLPPQDSFSSTPGSPNSSTSRLLSSSPRTDKPKLPTSKRPFALNKDFGDY
jgi:hypothetical protein